MDTTKSHGFFLASFFVFMFLGDLTEACGSCPEISLREACCRDDFVMRVQFLSVSQDPNFPSSQQVHMFRINSIRVFKGPKYLRNIWSLYTRTTESYCRYHHRGPFKSDDYLISGSIDKHVVEIRNCNFALPWNDVTLIDKMNLNGVAGKDCRTICAHG